MNNPPSLIQKFQISNPLEDEFYHSFKNILKSRINLSLGYRHIDSAANYGNEEEVRYLHLAEMGKK